MPDVPSSSVSISTTLMHTYRELNVQRCALLEYKHFNDTDAYLRRGKHLVFLTLHLVAGSLDTSVVSWPPSATKASERSQPPCEEARAVRENHAVVQPSRTCSRWGHRRAVASSSPHGRLPFVGSDERSRPFVAPTEGLK
ncbi:hypothetical protein C4D60_Mb08t23470 [Musa balbisiana]|uniref:Uncharacterized protein n=1 Tax=Musa balbisiana TaxID=52838 RepID=A0A4S8K5Y1_MUSBA|nr:hypothetical protein C4D60_Mb08t23470 [Musa balbisiana]